MTTSFTVPNVASATYPDQARLYESDFTILRRAQEGTAVLTGCDVTAQSPATMKVSIAAGTVQIDRTIYKIAAQESAALSADTVNPRWVLVEAKTDGTVALNAGTAAAKPVPPAPTASRVVLAAVYLPASTTSVTSSHIVGKSVTLDGPTPVFNVKTFGAVGDGVVDDTAALQAALSAAKAARGEMRMPAGLYKYSASIGTIDAPMCVRGAGWKTTRLIPDSSYSGYAFTVTNVNRNGEEQADDTTVVLASDLSGVELEGFEIVAPSRAATANGIVFQGPVDLLRMTNVSLRFLAGRALYFGKPDPTTGQGSVRESYFNNIRVVHCGTDTLPAVEIADGAAVVKDTASSATSTTITKTGATWTTNAFTNYQVRILSGTGSGQVRTVSSNTATTLTVSSSFSPTPDNTSVFGIYLPADGSNQMVFNGLWLVYNDGMSLFINASNENEVLRRIMINDLMLHGGSTTGTSHAFDLCQVQGRIQNVLFNNVRTNGSYDVSGTKYACIRIKADQYGWQPVDVVLNNWFQSSCSGHGIVAEAVDVLTVSGQSGAATISGNELVIGSSVGSIGRLELHTPSSTTRTFDINSTFLAKGQTRVAGTGRGYPSIFSGSGTPESSVKAQPGSLYLRTDGNSNTSVYAKKTGSDTNTGWEALDGTPLLIGPTYYDDNNRPLNGGDWSAVTEIKKASVDSSGTVTVGSTFGYMATDGFHDSSYTLIGSAQQLSAGLALSPRNRTSLMTYWSQGSTVSGYGTSGLSVTATSASSVSPAQNSPKATRMPSAGTAGVSAGGIGGATVVCRGANTDWTVAGFDLVSTLRFNDASYEESGASTGSRIAVGLTDQTALNTALSADNLSGSFVGFVRRSVNGGAKDTNWQLLSSDGTNVSTSDTTMAFTAQRWYTVSLSCKPGGSTFYWKIVDHTGGTTKSGSWSPTYLPAVSTMLTAMFGVRSVDAVTRGVDFNRLSVMA